MNKKIYLSVGNYGYLCGELSEGIRWFDYYSFEKEKIVSFQLEQENDMEISFCIKDTCDLKRGLVKQYFDALSIISSVLYFAGGKQKDVIIINCPAILNLLIIEIGYVLLGNTGKFVKRIEEFARERLVKYSSTEELYEHPSIVPWNLVPCDSDVLNILMDYIPLPSEVNILEIGSGFGKNLSYIKKLGYKNVTGIEYIRNAYEKSLNIPNINNNVVHGDITCTTFEDKSFDVIIDIGCLHCMPTNERIKGINEISRILKKNGIIISRCFKPKSTEWLNKYPVELSSFGLEKEKFIQLFNSHFKTIEVLESDRLQCNYFIGRCLK